MADHDRVPNAWTCSHADYDTGTTCNCVCGLSDPDCTVLDAPVAGCTAGQACFVDACVATPANDTCAVATPITIGTPVTGSTAGAQRNYNMGLEGQACTKYPQPGPDVAYSLSLTMGQQITITLTNSAMFDGAVALLGPGTDAICSAAPITTCVAGADVTFDGQVETVTYTATAAGTYYILVDSYAINEGGMFTLGVTSP